jgi:hypothetical protein
MDFEQKLNFFKTPKNSYTGPLSIMIQNMGVTPKKYGVSVSFYRKLVIFATTVG